MAFDPTTEQRKRVSDNKVHKHLRGQPPNPNRRKKLMPHLEDFDIIRVIGKGGFSTVFQGKTYILIDDFFSEEERRWSDIRDEVPQEVADQEREQGQARHERETDTAVSHSPIHSQNEVGFPISKSNNINFIPLGALSLHHLGVLRRR